VEIDGQHKRRTTWAYPGDGTAPRPSGRPAPRHAIFAPRSRRWIDGRPPPTALGLDRRGFRCPRRWLQLVCQVWVCGRVESRGIGAGSGWPGGRAAEAVPWRTTSEAPRGEGALFWMPRAPGPRSWRRCERERKRPRDSRSLFDRAGEASVAYLGLWVVVDRETRVLAVRRHRRCLVGDIPSPAPGTVRHGRAHSIHAGRLVRPPPGRAAEAVTASTAFRDLRQAGHGRRWGLMGSATVLQRPDMRSPVPSGHSPHPPRSLRLVRQPRRDPSRFTPPPRRLAGWHRRPMTKANPA
jgi:hypothetical protein